MKLKMSGSWSWNWSDAPRRQGGRADSNVHGLVLVPSHSPPPPSLPTSNCRSPCLPLVRQP